MINESNSTEARYGTWKSPVSSEMVTSGSIRFGDVVVDGDNVYWTEGRSYEGGRNAIMSWSNDNQAPVELLAAPFNARTRVHEYGGGALAVHDEIIYFTNDQDQRVYRFSSGGAPEVVSADDHSRYADFVVDAARNRLIAVREDHRTSDINAVNTIAAISLLPESLGDVETLASGKDFYSNPRISPDGSQLAWLEWNHPNMPWDGCELRVAAFNDEGLLGDSLLVAGAEDESIFQPEWSPEGALYFVSDRTEWWNLYAWRDGVVTAIHGEDAEYGGPAWSFGRSTYDFVDENTALTASTRLGNWRLEVMDLRNSETTPVDLPSTVIDQIRVGKGAVYFLAASPVEETSLVCMNIATNELIILRQSSTTEIERKYLSAPGSVSFPTTDDQVAHAFFYPPQNDDFHAPEGELPPVIVLSHGGPTGSTSTALDLTKQFYTSRGYAVLDVNYRGSTGYGRSYRNALRDNWGIYDVDDCVAGAEYLVAEGLADPDRLIIKGGSASGYTTLAALTFKDTFAIGSSHYGISDLEAMATETHKFESRYLDGLIGPYPEAKSIYIERSPIHHLEGLSCPLLLFQGTEDKVVPPNQAQMMYDAVKAKGVPVALVMYEGEQHGFRKAENIRNVLETQLTCFSRIFGIDQVDPTVDVEIANL